MRRRVPVEDVLRYLAFAVDYPVSYVHVSDDLGCTPEQASVILSRLAKKRLVTISNEGRRKPYQYLITEAGKAKVRA